MLSYEEEAGKASVRNALGVPRAVTGADPLKALSTLKGSTRDRALASYRAGGLLLSAPA